MNIEALATVLTIEKNNLDIHCDTSKKNNSCDVCYCLCCFWSMLVQDLEGVRSSLSNFFRTISPKPRSNHQRSIWIILPQSLKKNTTFCTIFSWNTSKEGHTCLRGLCYERKLQKSKNVLLYKKWKKTSTNTASCRIWIMLRQIFWKTVTGKQHIGQIFRKTERNGRSR